MIPQGNANLNISTLVYLDSFENKVLDEAGKHIL